MTDRRILVGLACPQGVEPELWDWLTRLLPSRLGHALQIVRVDGEAEVSWANNQLVQRFLGGDWSHLWFVAADLRPYPQTHTILDADADVAIGVSFVVEPDPLLSQFVHVWPNVCRTRDGRAWAALAWGELDGAPVDVDGGGMHCTLVSRRVLEDPRVLTPDGAWFRTERDALGRRVLTDDCGFCWRAKQAGYAIRAYPRALSGHVKTCDIGGVWTAARARALSEV